MSTAMIGKPVRMITRSSIVKRDEGPPERAPIHIHFNINLGEPTGLRVLKRKPEIVHWEPMPAPQPEPEYVPTVVSTQVLEEEIAELFG